MVLYEALWQKMEPETGLGVKKIKPTTEIMSMEIMELYHILPQLKANFAYI